MSTNQLQLFVYNNCLKKNFSSQILREITNFLTGSSRTEHEAAAAVGGKDLYGAGQVVNDNELFADDQVKNQLFVYNFLMWKTFI